jgi:two-component system, cell cycle response regulator DivK
MAGKLVLVVEDNPRDLKLVRDVLRAKGYEVIDAGTAEAGIELARAQQPALILMDVMLPGMDGRQAAKLLKEDPQTREIPIVALTSFAMKGDREKLLAGGFDGYIAKPIDIKELPKALAAYLHA